MEDGGKAELMAWRREQHERTSKTHGAEPQNQNKGSSSSLSSKDTSLEEDNYAVNHGGEAASRKRGRVSWKHIHPLFVNAVNQLGGPDNAKPRRIIEIMKVPGLTGAHAGSHLQKYRDGLKRIEEEQQNYSVSDMNGSLFPMEPHLYNYHRAHQPIQIQMQPPEKNFNNFGPELLTRSGPELYRDLFISMSSGSSSKLFLLYCYYRRRGYYNDGIINQKQAPGTSFGSNMPQQPQIGTCFGSNQNPSYGVRQPDQDPASGSSSLVNGTRIAHNEGIINEEHALSTSSRSNLRQQPQIGTNLTSNMQQLNQNQASGSYYVSTVGGANNDGIINQKQALCSSLGSNMPQQPLIDTSFGSNQNLTYGVQQPDQDPASGSTPYATTARGANNDGAISQHQAICFRGETLQQPRISQDQNPKAGVHDGIVNTEETHVTQDDDDFYIDVKKIYESYDDYEP
ncbi:hypothetical protein K1719_003521 [Acacia pycnantha]|nr:hypothetical protein K1719_003521 [Acacia pycnantha]